MPSAALEEAKRSLKKNPKDAGLNRLMGGLLLKEGNYKESLRYFQLSTIFSPRIIPNILVDFEEYITDNIDNVQARLVLVDFYILQGDIDSAILELEELVEISPETAAIYNKFGRLYLKIGKVDGAISLLEKALETGKIDEILLESLAGAYIEKERYADAVNLYEKIVALRPSGKRALRALGELYVRLSNYESAALRYAQMLDDDPEVISEVTEKLEELARTTPNSTFVHEQLADVYIKSLKPSKAVIELSRVIKLDPKKTGSAISALRRLLQTYPDERDAMFLLAQCLIDQGAFSESAEIFNSLEKMDPALSDKCAAGYKKILALYPGQAFARKSLGDLHFSCGKLKEAMSEYMAVLKLDPSESREIERKCREILKLNPQMIEPCLVLAESFLVSGDNRKAITLAEEIVQKDSGNFDAYRILSEGYMKIEVLNRAKDALRCALKLAPYDEDLQTKYRQVSEKELDREISLIKSKIAQDPWRIGLNLDLARLLFKRGSLDAASRALQSALKDATRAAASHKLMGVIFKEQWRYDLALAQFEKMLEFKSDDAETEKIAWSQAGSCKEACGMVSEAVGLYEKVLSLDMEFESLAQRVKYLNNTSSSSVRNKSLAAVIDLEGGFVKAVWGRDGRRHRADDEDLMSVTFGQGQNNTGFEKFLKDKVKEAEEDFTLASQLDPGLFASQNNLAVIHLRNKDAEKARLLLSNLMIEDSTHPVYLNNLGVLFAVKGDLESAEKNFLAALKSDKEFNAPNFNLSQILLKKDLAKEALEYFRKIGSCDPLYETAQRQFYYRNFH
ncbi:MAG: tetratricopeptide repeat protein [Candidatus Margulisiibacteriota bacterium]